MDLLEIFKSSILYIEDHLSESISVKDVTHQASVSNFYFQRMFSVFTGMNVGDYIRQRRLSLAAQELLIDDVKIIDLAYKYGYETPESFARAFRKFHGVLPKEVKEHPNQLKLCPHLEIIVSVKGGKTMDYKITQRDAFKITLLIKKFKDDTSTKDIPKFWDEYWKKGYGKDVWPMLGVCLPAEQDQKEFDYGIGALNECVKRVPKGFVEKIVPAGTWAEFAVVGAMPEAIQATWRKIYTEWLPNSRYEIIPSYDFEVYEEGDIHSPAYKSAIWIPVRLKG